jgi:hypothetical protein
MKSVFLFCATFGLLVAAPAALAATCDFDGDGKCGDADRGILMSLQGAASGDANYRADVDLDGDGVISLVDASLFIEMSKAQ